MEGSVGDGAPLLYCGEYLAAVSLLALGVSFVDIRADNFPRAQMRLRYSPYTLRLRHTFTISANSRTTTPLMLVEVEADGITGYGEASMPPYLGETQDTAAGFLSRVRLHPPATYEELVGLLQDVDALAAGNHAAKAAIDIGLHDWFGKKTGKPWWRIWNLNPSNIPPTSFTIGIDTPDVLREKVREASAFRVLKVKLGTEYDMETIETIRSMTDVPLRVDANQGWNDRELALRMILWLAKMGVELVEQPMPKEKWEDQVWLKERSPIPIVADEAVGRFTDIENARHAYHGINIKLMKCTGLAEAHRMIRRARELNLNVMLGCMTETSCAISAAAQLAPLVDWVDLDGALLITNDPFNGAKLTDGRIVPTDRAGIGVVPA